jgi:hypothetical protein
VIKYCINYYVRIMQFKNKTWMRPRNNARNLSFNCFEYKTFFLVSFTIKDTRYLYIWFHSNIKNKWEKWIGFFLHSQIAGKPSFIIVYNLPLYWSGVNFSTKNWINIKVFYFVPNNWIEIQRNRKGDGLRLSFSSWEHFLLS